MPKIVPEIDTRGLREFGFVCATIIVLLFGFFFPVVVFEKPVPKLAPAFQIAIVLSTVALVLPVVLKPIYIVWMAIGFVLGWINTRIVLGLVYFMLFTPVALFLRLFRVDPMRRKFDRDTISYKRPSTLSPKQQMEKPY
ncbi:MAG: SxtJ family membrane protein [Methylococcaceae bacterium]|nr:SxtJ family membrane protein [Methylococcaceae bacterium]MCI0667909.1 SxtJ family membrane protein [Methylococcaceae bacterium]MCI0732738.1 SxtJ family membrane protein [Methylococcaceae bacterium]